MAPPERTWRSADPASGIVVDRVPYVTAATLAYGNDPQRRPKRAHTYLVDQPVDAKKNGRICSRFTVESEWLVDYLTPDEALAPRERMRHANWQKRVLEMLQEKGIDSAADNGGWSIVGLDAVDHDQKPDAQEHGAGKITHRCKLIDHRTGAERPALVAVYPQDARVGVANIRENVFDALTLQPQDRDRVVLIVVGAEIAGVSRKGVDGDSWQIEVACVEAAKELHIAETKRKRSDPESALVMVAEPNVIVERLPDDSCVAEVDGYHEWNPVTSEAHYRSGEHVRMWMLDTDYDGTCFNAQRFHLDAAVRCDENRRVLELLLGRHADRDAVSAVFGKTSMPFTPGSGGLIAIRVITRSGQVISWHDRVENLPRVA